MINNTREHRQDQVRTGRMRAQRLSKGRVRNSKQMLAESVAWSAVALQAQSFTHQPPSVTHQPPSLTLQPFFFQCRRFGYSGQIFPRISGVLGIGARVSCGCHGSWTFATVQPGKRFPKVKQDTLSSTHTLALKSSFCSMSRFKRECLPRTRLENQNLPQRMLPNPQTVCQPSIFVKKTSVLCNSA